jgi:hypothetical protein
MLAGPVGRELYFTNYPARPEAFLLPLIAAAVGASVAIGSRVVGGVLGSVAFGGLLFAFADLQFDPQEWTYTALVLAGCIVLAQLLISRRAAITALALGAFYLTSVWRPGIAPPPQLDTAGPSRPDNPLLVHIVLDEQWGVGGLRAAGDTATAAFLTDFYLTRGFELFESAYSHHMLTEESLQSAMLVDDTITGFLPRRRPYAHVMQRNPYFRRLRELGYKIRVYQPTFMDFCSDSVAVVASCDVRSGNSIANIGYLDGSWVERGRWAARYFLHTRSHVHARLAPDRISWRRSSVGGGLDALQRLATDIAAHPVGGTAWFAHVLAPHRPLQLDSECRIADLSGMVGYAVPGTPVDSLSPDALKSYAGQVRCTHRVIDRVIDAIDSAVGRDSSIVIVHGDHGSRLHAHDPDRPLAAYSSAELNTDFATLLAVRRPRVPATIHREPAPIQGVIRALARSNFTGPLPGSWEHYVSELWRSDKPVVRALTITDMLWARRHD